MPSLVCILIPVPPLPVKQWHLVIKDNSYTANIQYCKHTVTKFTRAQVTRVDVISAQQQIILNVIYAALSAVCQFSHTPSQRVPARK